MKLRFTAANGDGPVAVLHARVDAIPPGHALAYTTRTGALLRIDGRVAGAFDREHAYVPLAPCGTPVTLQLEVERRSLPSSGLPAGPGLRWKAMLRAAAQKPALAAQIVPWREHAPAPAAGVLPMFGHAHLDVAWLWRYEETARKAVRTFATAVRQLEANPHFVFAQSQPQLYAFVEAADPELFARVRTLAQSGRFDPGVAALWVEPDCNVPSGESFLRQLLHAHEYISATFGRAPQVAWLPDSFGFPNTLPTLLAHAGIVYFATTKLRWNDTTEFPYAQFRWRGPDGSETIAALIDSYEGVASPQRVATAQRRNEPLVLGYGDGGGGVSEATLAHAPGTWTPPAAWFATLHARRAGLPVHEDELYLEYHRGTYTTHHDVKAGNFALERALDHAEELAAWCVAMNVSPAVRDDLRARLHEAWRIVLRNQFHDVLPGTSIGAVYDDVHAEYDAAATLLEQVAERAASILPRMPVRERFLERCEAYERDGGYFFDNGLLRASVARDGTIRDLRAGSARNVVAAANRFFAYADRPRKWEAWNIDRGYDRKPRRVRFRGLTLKDGAVEARYQIGASTIVCRTSLFAAEPYLRIDLDVDWNERRTLLRAEHWLAIDAQAGTFGTPHGSIVRPLAAGDPAARAKFEFPAQRLAAFTGQGAGLAVFTTDSYGWSARALRKGGVQAGLSLLRGTRWPDPDADRGPHQFAYAFVPYEAAGMGALERAWRSYAHAPRVRLFTCDDDAVAIVACKPAQDGDGVVVRVRETEGRTRRVALKSTARARSVAGVDALERPLEGGVSFEDAALQFDLRAHAVRAFRVRYTA